MRARATTALRLGMAAALAALVADGAAAHGGAEAGLRPVLDAPPGALAGMRVQLRETLGAQLVLENPTARTVEVLGEDGVPFLRIGPRGAEGNLSAPSWYRTLGPASTVPTSAAAGAAPRWRLASAEPSFGWFDPRLDPATAPRSGPDGRWQVPLRVDGERVVLSGRFLAAPVATGRYAARLTSPSELAPGVRVTLLPGRAPGLLVHNASDRALLVFGADGEPFLRIGPEGVDANARSRSWQQSARSTTRAPVEAGAPSPAAPSAPEWQRISPVPRFGWIEPRALVTDAGPEAPGSGGDVLAWRVPMQLGDEPVSVTGSVAWQPLRADAPQAHRDPGHAPR